MKNSKYQKPKKTNPPNRGSEWRKCDLHLHSFYTSLGNKYNSSTVEEYIQKIKDNKIEIVGLTNYFNFNPNDWLLKESLEKQGIKTFLNLELRLTYTNKEDDCCDLHLIFSDQINKKDIDAFLTKLNCNVNGTSKMLSTLNTIEKKTAVVEFQSILNILNDPAMESIKNSILIGMLSRGKGSSRSSQMYESMALKAHFIIHSSNKVSNLEKDVNYWSGKSNDKPRVSKAVFQNSDAHAVDDIGKKYTWIKGSPCFETLRQAVVDFENRICIQDRNPIDGKSSSPELFIDHVEFQSNNKKETIFFNQDINSVIGKRGAGKSVLLKHIAQAIGANKAKDIYKFNDFKVHWSDCTDTNKFVEYIPQNYLSTITYEDGEKYPERDQKLRELLFNNESFRNADTKIKEIVDSIELKITAKIKEILKLNIQESDIQLQLRSLGTHPDKAKSIEEKQQKIKELGTIDITEDDIQRQTQYSSYLNSSKTELQLLQQDYDIIDNIISNYSNDFLVIDDAMFSGLSQSTSNAIKKHIDNVSNTDINQFLKDMLIEFKQNINKKNIEIKSFQNVLDPLNKKITQNKTIEDILTEINKLKIEKEEIIQLQGQITSISSKKKILINEIIKDYFSYKHKIESVVNTLKNTFHELSFITFEFTVAYDVEMYKKEFFEIFIDGRSGDRLYKYIQEQQDFNEKELEKIILDIINHTLKIKTSKGTEENALISLLSCRYKIDFTKSVKYKENDGNLVDFENMTGGQKAMALLDLIFNLSKSRFPIIIDQPENDIDVSGVSNELKELILKQKQKRQVIIATHSPNLLLLVDTENIIVAINKNNTILYQNGGIEDKNIQKFIVDILEGGKEALNKRMDKLILIKNILH